MDAYFMAELNERLFTHFSGGAWRAPYAQRLLVVGRDPDRPLGQIVCAGPRDLARALTGLERAAAAPAPEVLQAALEGAAPVLARLRDAEGFSGDAPGPLRPVALPATLPVHGPFVLLSSASLPLTQLIPLLVAGAVQGMIWKPAPGGAASGHLLMRILGPLAGGRLAMVQGDHTTGAALAGMGPLIWASEAPPPAALPAPAFSVKPADPAHP